MLETHPATVEPHAAAMTNPVRADRREITHFTLLNIGPPIYWPASMNLALLCNRRRAAPR